MREKRYQTNIFEIERICSQFELKDYYTEEVKRLYYKALCQDLTQGKELTTIIGSLIYYVHRRDAYPIPMKRISKELQTSTKTLFKRYKQLKKRLRLEIENYDYSNLINKYNNKIRLNTEQLNQVNQTYEQMNGYYNDPRVKIATAFYLVGKGEYSIKTISENTNVSQSAIQVLANKMA